MSAPGTSPGIDDPDTVFAALIAAHEGLDDAASRRLDARIVLLLASRIGRSEVILDAIAEARRLG